VSATPTLSLPPHVLYPESDGQPMADNIRQLNWILLLVGNLRALFRDRPDVLVAGNQFWYPVEGRPEIRAAPDVYVVFGRPKGERGSYKQWEEDSIAMTVVFEVLSPGNTFAEMDEKLDFYDQYGADEYYIYNPDTNHLTGYVRSGTAFLKVRPITNHVSPRLGIRFDLSGSEMVVYGPDGKPFVSFEDLKAAAEDAEQRAGKAGERAEQAERRLARALELSRKARRGQATPDEIAELDRLEARA